MNPETLYFIAGAFILSIIIAIIIWRHEDYSDETIIVEDMYEIQRILSENKHVDVEHYHVQGLDKSYLEVTYSTHYVRKFGTKTWHADSKGIIAIKYYISC